MFLCVCVCVCVDLCSAAGGVRSVGVLMQKVRKYSVLEPTALPLTVRNTQQHNYTQLHTITHTCCLCCQCCQSVGSSDVLSIILFVRDGLVSSGVNLNDSLKPSVAVWHCGPQNLQARPLCRCMFVFCLMSPVEMLYLLAFVSVLFSWFTRCLS